ncbi:hypothetical protein IGI04_014129 [Brassica rapa subsp. trilocularis]|uniref:Uncharacterized protein n=1 Tax=Brassica rapa subsp. trilocularis TaxID=1813537 RepID=A0ABQ7MLH1_BRACM|nr:hypothetical protein IGI04_014129 [Brassica rapa subsp. trilocularis]
MEQIVEKVCEERLNTGVSKISVYFYKQFHFFKGWKLTNDSFDIVCFKIVSYSGLQQDILHKWYYAELLVHLLHVTMKINRRGCTNFGNYLGEELQGNSHLFW